MYVPLLLSLCLPYVQMYIVPADTTVAALPSSTHNWGPERSPFIQPCGASYFFDSGQEQEHLTTFLDPGSTCKLYIFTHDHLWLVIVILKTQSRRLLHSCIVLCVLAYVLCFLGALARGLFLKKTHSG